MNGSKGRIHDCDEDILLHGPWSWPIQIKLIDLKFIPQYKLNSKILKIITKIWKNFLASF